MKTPTLAPAYCYLYPLLASTANKLGYALAIHGSMTKAMDLIAIPWVEDAADEQALVDAVVEAVSGEQPLAGQFDASQNKWVTVNLKEPSQKPHGRKVWTIILKGGAYIDLGVMPRTATTITNQ